MTDLGGLLQLSRWVPVRPYPKQAAFLMATEREVLYGGSAGGAKSYALLMAALQYVDVPGYHALIIRKTFAQLAKAGALIPLSQEWLSGTAAEWNAQRSAWTFPSGATLEFGHMENATARYNYQGAAYQFIGWDELTQQTRQDYTYVSFSRRRRTLDMADVPVRVRATANPGGIGHDWVFDRFMVQKKAGRLFIPASLADNRDLDREEYIASLDELDPVERRQLLHGDWEVRPAGNLFKRDWFQIVDAEPARLHKVRYWDHASTEADKGKDPDWTVGLLLGRDANGLSYVCDVQRFRSRTLEKENRIRQVAELDGREVRIAFEQEPGSSGKDVADRMVRVVLNGFPVTVDKKTGSKLSRARPVSSQAEAGNIRLVRGPWNKAFLDELEPFPQEGIHDDQVDALSGAFWALGTTRPGDTRAYAEMLEQTRKPAEWRWEGAR